MNRADAPWTFSQVISLNAYQASGRFHPFTGERKENGDETVLIATLAGWTETSGGPIVQTWAHEFMADWSWGGELLEHAEKAHQDFKSNADGLSYTAWLGRAKIIDHAKPGPDFDRSVDMSLRAWWSNMPPENYNEIG